MNALQILDGASPADGVVWHSLPVQVQLDALQAFLCEHMHVPPAEVLRLCAVTPRSVPAQQRHLNQQSETLPLVSAVVARLNIK